MRGRALARVGVALVTAALFGCGGGGGGSDDAPGLLTVFPAADGLFRSDLTIDAANPTLRIAVGGDGANFVHGWIRFIHAPTTIALVADGVVTNVTIEITKVSKVGDPQGQHATAELRHSDFGDLIEGGDYSLAGTPVANGIFAPTGTGTQTFTF